MSLSKARRHGEVATWDEDPNTFEDFVYDAFMFRDELPPKSKRQASAKICRSFKERGAAAWRLVKGLREDNVFNKTLQGPFGIEYLLQQLKRTLCPQAVPDIAKHIDNYLYRFKRQPSESMTEYIARDGELYSRMCQALARVGADPKSDLLESTDWVRRTYDFYKAERQQWRNWQSSGWGSYASRWTANYNSWDQDDWRTGEPDASRDVDDFSDLPGFYDSPTRNTASEPEQGQIADEEWQGEWLQDPWWNEGVEPWQNRPSIQPLPDALLGWLLLYRAGLERPERLSIQSAVAHSWSRAAVAQALKDQWPEHELTKRDARKPQEARRDRYSSASSWGLRPAL